MTDTATTRTATPGTHPCGASAHRGDAAHAPANTVPAMESAVRKGAQQIEFDVKMSRDKRLLIRHDWTVDATTDGSGRIADLSFDELRRLDAGSGFSAQFSQTRIPTLEEVLQAIPHHVLANVHVHDDPEIAVRVALRLEELERLDHCFLTLGTRADFARAAARAAVPGILLCKGHATQAEVTRETAVIPADILHLCHRAFADADIDPRIDFIQLVGGTPDQVRHAARMLHAQDVRVNYCCASTWEDIAPLVDTGVDYILTDALELCLGMLADGDASAGA